LPFAGTSHGDDEVYFFPSMSRRAILGTLPACARPLSPARPSLSRHATCHGGVSVTSLGYAGSAGLCPTPRGWARRSPVALTFTRLTLPSAYLRFGCWSSLCPVSLLTKEPKIPDCTPNATSARDETLARSERSSVRTRVYMANLALVIATGIFVLLSVIGFFWMNKLIAQNSYSYLASLDYSNMWNIATASGCVALFAYIVYMINYPEGELARDAAATFKEKKAERDLARDRDAKKAE
jgi:hypothetical protein